jgi:hypothetical protein
MPRLANGIAKVHESCAILVYGASDIRKGPRKAYLVPISIRIDTVAFLDGGHMQFYVDGKPGDPVIIEFLPESHERKVLIVNV